MTKHHQVSWNLPRLYPVQHLITSVIPILVYSGNFPLATLCPLVLWQSLNMQSLKRYLCSLHHRHETYPDPQIQNWHPAVCCNRRSLTSHSQNSCVQGKFWRAVLENQCQLGPIAASTSLGSNSLVSIKSIKRHPSPCSYCSYHAWYQVQATGSRSTYKLRFTIQ